MTSYLPSRAHQHALVFKVVKKLGFGNLEVRACCSWRGLQWSLRILPCLRAEHWELTGIGAKVHRIWNLREVLRVRGKKSSWRQQQSSSSESHRYQTSWVCLELVCREWESLMALVRKDSGEKKQKPCLEVAWSQEWGESPPSYKSD